VKPPTLPLNPGEIRSALFVRLRRFGDTIVLGACVRLFKRWAPHARLTVLVQPGYDALLRPLREIDEIAIVERGARGAQEALEYLLHPRQGWFAHPHHARPPSDDRSSAVGQLRPKSEGSAVSRAF